MSTIFDGTNTKLLTMAHILRWRAQHLPLREAYTFLLDGETKKVQMTYADLDLQARHVAALLQDCATIGTRVLLLYPPGLEYVAAIFGCFYAGVVAVPAYPPRLNQNLTRIQTIFQDAQATAVLTTSTILSSLRRTFANDPFMQNLHWIETGQAQGPVPIAPAFKEFYTDPESLALLQYTSGTTASPKGVMLTHNNLMQNAMILQKGLSPVPEDYGLSWLPPYHDMGLMTGILQSLYTGYPTMLMAPATFLQQPLRWLRAISTFHVTFTGGPNFAYDLCVKKATEDAIETLDLSGWTMAFNGAEPVRPETLERFAQTFASCGFRPETFYPGYGLAEVTLFVSGGRREELPKIQAFDGTQLEAGQAVPASVDQQGSRRLVSCGVIREGQEMAIVDPQTLIPCVPGTIGEIWLRGPNVARGYWEKAQETRETFQACLQGESAARPFLRTGDLGFCLAGDLYVTGRLKDLIVIRGRNLYPQDIEQVAEKSHPLLRQGYCAAFAVEGETTEQLVIVQEVGRHYDELGLREAVQAMCQAVLTEFDVEVAAIELVRAGTISKTSSGKIQRRACRQSFLRGELKTVFRWNRDQERAQGEAGPQVGPANMPSYNGGQNPNESDRNAQRIQEIVDWLIRHIKEHTHIATRAIDIHAPFVQFGLNSLEVVDLSGELEEWLGRSLSPTILYDYPSIKALARHLAEGEKQGSVDGKQEAEALPLQQISRKETGAIAIIGLGCRFPGANNPEEFWQMLYDGVDGISDVDSVHWATGGTRWDVEKFYHPEQATPGKMNTRWGGFLQNIEQFDPAFFNIAPREAAYIDPQQRLLLEVAWETLENAGQAPDQLVGSQTGVFIGISSEDYLHMQFKNPGQIDTYTGTGGAHSIAANRLSYTFDLRGPSITTDTACSSSLVALHQACQSLRLGECDLALAGGVNVILTPEPTITFSQIRTMSADGRCKTFDASADGYQQRVSASVLQCRSEESESCDRWGEPLLLAHESASDGGRDRSRQHSVFERPTGHHHGRPGYRRKQSGPDAPPQSLFSAHAGFPGAVAEVVRPARSDRLLHSR